jgi:hypothetical protein
MPDPTTAMRATVFLPHPFNVLIYEISLAAVHADPFAGRLR